MTTLIDFYNNFETLWEKTEEELDKALPKIIHELEQNAKPIANTSFENVKSLWGVYVFFIIPNKKFNEKKLIKDWENSNEGHIKFPKVCKSRFEKSIHSKTTHYTFYIGKSEQVGKRIKEHITHNKHASTYGLKLKDRHFTNTHKITYAYWQLPNTLQENNNKPIKQFIITQLERKLRNRLNPWIGKQ
ncbi:hypothetical protein [Mangrovimonas cancribranchiae]|uniref:GIY-YIG domain-containing protein n=1 Tax=Mangrovimonas cancribranchiae TaxID=3080055 RepID=A0AAU6P9K5_9FLAO